MDAHKLHQELDLKQNQGSLDLRLFNNALTTKLLKKYVMENHFNTNAADINGHTLLHFAAKSDDIDILKLLLSRGCHINAKTKHGRTALHIAVEWGKKRNITFLLDHGADANIKDKMGKTALHLVAGKDLHFYGKKLMDRFEKVTKLLLQKGALINECDMTGQTPIFVAVQGRKKRTIEILLENGAQINLRDRNQLSPLHFAIFSDDKDIVKVLLDKGADVHTTDKVGNNSLHFAASRGNSSIVQLLLNHGAFIDDQRDDGFTALHIAVDVGTESSVEVLLRNNCNLNVKDAIDRTPFHILARKCLHGCPKEEVHKFKRIAKSLLAHGFDVNNDLNDGELTVLHCAVLAKNITILKLLLEHKADVNKTSYGESSLHCAARSKNAKIVRTLLKYGADVNNRTGCGLTALHIAVSSEDEDVIQILLDHHADINALDRDKCSPLGLASNIMGMYNNSSTLKVLIRHIAISNEEKISAENRQLLLSNQKLNKLYNECLDEVKKLKSKNIYSNLSFYSILKNQSESDLEEYVRNRNIMNVFKTGRYKDEFPLYCDILIEKYYRGMQRMHLSKTVEKSLDFVWKYCRFPELVVRNIMYNLSTEDLQFLENVIEHQLTK